MVGIIDPCKAVSSGVHCATTDRAHGAPARLSNVQAGMCRSTPNSNPLDHNKLREPPIGDHMTTVQVELLQLMEGEKR